MLEGDVNAAFELFSELCRVLERCKAVPSDEVKAHRMNTIPTWLRRGGRIVVWRDQLVISRKCDVTYWMIFPWHAWIMVHNQVLWLGALPVRLLGKRKMKWQLIRVQSGVPNLLQDLVVLQHGGTQDASKKKKKPQPKEKDPSVVHKLKKVAQT